MATDTRGAYGGCRPPRYQLPSIRPHGNGADRLFFGRYRQLARRGASTQSPLLFDAVVAVLPHPHEAVAAVSGRDNGGMQVAANRSCSLMTIGTPPHLSAWMVVAQHSDGPGYRPTRGRVRISAELIGGAND